MSDDTPQLQRFRAELTNSVGDGPWLDAPRRAEVHDTGDNFQIDAATDEDAEVLRGEEGWIMRSAHDAGRPHTKTEITGPRR